jgi:hypothetical protein
MALSRTGAFVRLATELIYLHHPGTPYSALAGAVEAFVLPGACCTRRKTLSWRRVLDTVLVAAAGTSAGGKQGIGQRLTRHMVTLAMPSPSDAVLRSVCTAILGGFLGSGFTPGAWGAESHSQLHQLAQHSQEHPQGSQGLIA